MPGNVNATSVWENSSDTTLIASNLSKTINYVSESKFIEYTDSTSDYASWADYSTITQPAASSTYVDKIVYVTDTGTFIKGYKNQDNTYGWLTSGFAVPTDKLLKIKAKTKIGMSYTNTDSDLIYLNYDTGSSDTVFSVESILNATDFSANLNYYIYLYNTSTLGDNAVLKIVSEYDDTNNTGSWKQGAADTSSPTGTKVIAIRKIGGFRTDSSAKIDSDSLWDLSTYNSEIITEEYKIIDDDGVRALNASDIPILDENENFTAENIEDALIDVKTNVDQLYEDMYYTADRYGVQLEFSIFTQTDSTLSVIDFNNNSLIIPLRITPGYINVAGKKVQITSPIYLGNLDNTYLINNYTTEVTGVRLGSTPTSPYGTSTAVTVLYPGIWRVYINSDGTIIFRESDAFVPQFLQETVRKGWYYSSDSSRCIGKFRIVTGSSGFYLEKMSITNTFDVDVPKNSVYTIHGTLCPDGLFLCDGKWHDVTGNSYAVLDNMPAPTNTLWSSGWWDQTPDMYGRTFKMFDKDDFDTYKGQTIQYAPLQSAFKWTVLTDSSYVSVTNGSSDECGDSGGNSTHTHTISHTHSTTDDDWNLYITNSSGEHTHDTTTIVVAATSSSSTQNVVQQTSTTQQAVSVALGTHTHTISTTSGGKHGHAEGSFSGSTGQPSSSTTGATDTWAPYKEFIMCIKK